MKMRYPLTVLLLLLLTAVSASAQNSFYWEKVCEEDFDDYQVTWNLTNVLQLSKEHPRWHDYDAGETSGIMLEFDENNGKCLHLYGNTWSRLHLFDFSAPADELYKIEFDYKPGNPTRSWVGVKINNDRWYPDGGILFYDDYTVSLLDNDVYSDTGMKKIPAKGITTYESRRYHIEMYYDFSASRYSAYMDGIHLGTVQLTNSIAGKNIRELVFRKIKNAADGVWIDNVAVSRGVGYTASNLRIAESAEETVVFGRLEKGQKGRLIVGVYENKRLIRLETEPVNGSAYGIMRFKPQHPYEYRVFMFLESLEPMTERQTYTAENSLSWFTVEGVAGYYFPQGGKVVISKKPEVSLDGKTQGFVKAYISHGKNPKNASYAYVIIPEATPGEMKAYSQQPDIEILSNTEQCQAVRKISKGVTGYVFYEGGVCGELSVSAPCMVMTGEQNGIYEFSLSDAEKKYHTITVTVNRLLSLIDYEGKISAMQQDGKTIIRVKTFGSLGKPQRATFRIE